MQDISKTIIVHGPASVLTLGNGIQWMEAGGYMRFFGGR